jgi:hypothetical protein
MPKLYGAPAYARPPVLSLNPVEKPFDPDDLPLEAERTNEDVDNVEVVAQLQPRTYETVATAEAAPADHDASKKLHGRPFRIKLPGRGNGGR